MAVTAIPQWLLGRHITAVSIQGFTVGSDNAGTITLDTSQGAAGVQAITARLSGVNVRQSATVVEISPINVILDNDVLVSSRTDLELTELTPKDGISILAQAAQSFSYVKVVFTRGSRTWTHFGPIVGFDEGTEGKGSMPARMRIGMSATNDTNPTYAA